MKLRHGVPLAGSVTLRHGVPLAASVTFALLALPHPQAIAAQGSGNPTLTVSPASLPGKTESIVTLTGTDYLVPPHTADQPVSGGVYLLFGAVTEGAWGPSARNASNANGTFGVTYFYPGESGGSDTRATGPSDGTTGLVSFTAAGETGDATEAHMNDQGDWTAKVKIPGAVFTTTLPDGSTREISCYQIQCGVYTIGAHGKASATNEKFAPLTFTDGGAQAAEAAVAQTPAAEAPVAQTPAAQTPAAPTPAAQTSAAQPAGALVIPPSIPSAAPASSAPVSSAPASAAPSGSPSAVPLDGDTVAVGVSAVSDTGGGVGALPLAAGLGSLLAGGSALFLRRSRHRAPQNPPDGPSVDGALTQP